MPMVDVLLIIKFISSLEVAQTTQMVPYSTIVVFKKLLVKKWEQTQRPQIENRKS